MCQRQVIEAAGSRETRRRAVKRRGGRGSVVESRLSAREPSRLEGHAASDAAASDDRPRQPRRHHTSHVPGDQSLTGAHGRYLLFALAGARLAPRRLQTPFDTEDRPPSLKRTSPRITGRSCRFVATEALPVGQLLSARTSTVRLCRRPSFVAKHQRGPAISDERSVASRVAGGISAPGSHRSRRDSLPSPGSSDRS